MKTVANKIAERIVALADEHYSEIGVFVSDYMFDFEIPMGGIVYYGVCTTSVEHYTTHYDAGDYYQPPEEEGYSDVRFDLESVWACDEECVDIPCPLTRDDIQKHLDGVQLRYDW